MTSYFTKEILANKEEIKRLVNTTGSAVYTNPIDINDQIIDGVGILNSLPSGPCLTLLTNNFKHFRIDITVDLLDGDPRVLDFIIQHEVGHLASGQAKDIKVFRKKIVTDLMSSIFSVTEVNEVEADVYALRNTGLSTEIYNTLIIPAITNIGLAQLANVSPTFSIMGMRVNLNINNIKNKFKVLLEKRRYMTNLIMSKLAK